PVGFLEGERHFGGRAFGLCRIGHAPVRRHRLTGPQRARFARRVVTDGEHEIELWRAGIGKFAPRLRAKARGVIAEALQEPDRFEMHLALGMAPGAVGAEFTRLYPVQDRFRHDRARRVAGAQKQHVVWFGHGMPHAAGQPDAVAGSSTFGAGAQHGFSCATLATRSPDPSPYSMLFPVVWNVSQEMPAGSSIHDFSDLA